MSATELDTSDFQEFVERNYSDPTAPVERCLIDSCSGFKHGTAVEYAEHVYAEHDFYRRSYTKFRRLVARAIVSSNRGDEDDER